MIVQSKVSSITIEESAQFNHDESQTEGNNSRMVELGCETALDKEWKSFHKLATIIHPTTVFKAPEKTPREEIA